MRLRTPPRLPQGLKGDLPSELATYLEKLDAWTVDVRATLNSSLGTLDRDKQGKALPIELPALGNADLGGTKFRYGGPPAIVAVLDAPGGATLALRDGSAWRLLGSGGGGGGGNYFGVIAVPGQSNIVATADPTTLNVAAGTNVQLTTNAGTKTLTIAAAHNHDGAYTPLDADLVAISAFASTGIAVRTASNTWAQRSIAAGAGVVVSNGDGVSGNPTVSAPTAPAIKYLAANADTDDIVPAALTGLDFTVEAGKSYHFRFNLVYSEDEAGDIEASLAGPSASIFNAVQVTATQLL